MLSCTEQANIKTNKNFSSIKSKVHKLNRKRKWVSERKSEKEREYVCVYFLFSSKTIISIQPRIFRFHILPDLCIPYQFHRVFKEKRDHIKLYQKINLTLWKLLLLFAEREMKTWKSENRNQRGICVSHKSKY